MMIACAVVVGLLAVWALVWWVERDPPDDPWMLANGHLLAHHYPDGWGPGSVDHGLQEAAATKAASREVRINAIRLAHTMPAPRLRQIS